MDIFERLDLAIEVSEDEAMLLENERTLARGEFAQRAEYYDKSGCFPRDNINE